MTGDSASGGPSISTHPKAPPGAPPNPTGGPSTPPDSPSGPIRPDYSARVSEIECPFCGERVVVDGLRPDGGRENTARLVGVAATHHVLQHGDVPFVWVGDAYDDRDAPMADEELTALAVIAANVSMRVARIQRLRLERKHDVASPTLCGCEGCAFWRRLADGSGRAVKTHDRDDTRTHHFNDGSAVSHPRAAVCDYCEGFP